MMLIAHALPIKLRIIQKSGLRVLYVFLLRVLGALLVGFVLHQLYSAGNYLSQTNESLWNPSLVTDDSLKAWLMNQFKTFSQVFVIIALLITFLKILKTSGIENLIGGLLRANALKRQKAASSANKKCLGH